MRNKKKASLAVGISGLVLVACLTLTPMLKNQSVGAERANAQKIETIKEEQKQAEKQAKREQEYNSKEYQEYLQCRIDTMEVAIADMQKELDRGGVPEELIPETEFRVEGLTKILNKYNASMKKNRSNDVTTNIETADQLFENIDNFYNEIDNTFVKKSK